jgi:hypothetical protein
MIRAIKVSYDTSNLIRNDFASPPSALSNDDQSPAGDLKGSRYAGIEPGSEMGEPT